MNQIDKDAKLLTEAKKEPDWEKLGLVNPHTTAYDVVDQKTGKVVHREPALSMSKHAPEFDRAKAAMQRKIKELEKELDLFRLHPSHGEHDVKLLVSMATTISLMTGKLNMENSGYTQAADL